MICQLFDLVGNGRFAATFSAEKPFSPGRPIRFAKGLADEKGRLEALRCFLSAII